MDADIPPPLPRLEPPTDPEAPPQVTIVALLQLIAVACTIGFFLLLIVSYLFPTRSIFVIRAEAERVHFEVAPEYPTQTELTGMAVIVNGNSILSRCAAVQLDLRGGTQVDMQLDQALPIIELKTTGDETGDGFRLSYMDADGSSGTKDVSEGVVRLVPNRDPACFDGDKDDPRFLTVPFAGAGVIGDPNLEDGLASSWMNGEVEILSSGSLFCFLQITCPITDVTGGKRTLPFGANVEPMLLTTPFSWVQKQLGRAPRPNHNEARMFGHIRQQDGLFQVTASASAHALRVRSPNLENVDGYIRVGIMEVLYAEPMLAIVLGFFPMTTLSLSLLNKQGIGPYRLLNRTLARLRRRGQKDD